MKPHKVFISYSSKNVDVADTIYNMLESRQIPCWMAPHDLITGEDFGASIEEAIRTSQVVIFVFSKSSNKSRWVRSELSIAFSEEKLIIPFKIDGATPEGIVRMVLTKSQWIEALNESNEHYASLLERVKAALDAPAIREGWKERTSKMTSGLRLWPILLVSAALLVFSKYVDEAFFRVSRFAFEKTLHQYSEMSLIMTAVSVVASTVICLLLRNEGRKWSMTVLATVLVFALSFFAFIDVLDCLRNGEGLSQAELLSNPELLLYMAVVMTVPAIAAFYFIVRRIPSALVYFFLWWTLLFGVHIHSPWTILSCIPIALLLFCTSYSWYKRISYPALIVLITVLSVYLGMNFIEYQALMQAG